VGYATILATGLGMVKLAKQSNLLRNNARRRGARALVEDVRAVSE